MRSPNSAAIRPAEAEHMAAVKSCACVTCDAPAPSEAHHVVQGDHYTTVALCQPCHRGPRGIHGDQTMLRLRYRIAGTQGELRAINDTLARIARNA